MLYVLYHHLLFVTRDNKVKLYTEIFYFIENKTNKKKIPALYSQLWQMTFETLETIAICFLCIKTFSCKQYFFSWFDLQIGRQKKRHLFIYLSFINYIFTLNSLHEWQKAFHELYSGTLQENHQIQLKTFHCTNPPLFNNRTIYIYICMAGSHEAWVPGNVCSAAGA